MHFQRAVRQEHLASWIRAPRDFSVAIVEITGEHHDTADQLGFLDRDRPAVA
ncbi:hypothetical protein [Amycolatopsis sp. RTGN1]|uniref:hypothetical protein n=1 Tax=Amycolatopsis ponsaeliensis TaxID=2992142 RepID=UPI00254C6885|nr:hypothetical protein [Amycolatopsis sp. RTGN1]